MAKKEVSLIVPDELVMNKIYFIRGHKVMIDSDLAELYSVDNKLMKRQVRRNIDRFPSDFMFELTKKEYDSLRSQIGTLKRGGHSKYLPYVFTEHGVLMLSSVLNSKKAIQVNIQIMRIFTRIRLMLTENTDLRLAMEKLEKKTDNNTKNIELVFQYFEELSNNKEKVKPRKKVGFKIPKKK